MQSIELEIMLREVVNALLIGALLLSSVDALIIALNSKERGRVGVCLRKCLPAGKATRQICKVVNRGNSRRRRIRQILGVSKERRVFCFEGFKGKKRGKEKAGRHVAAWTRGRW